MALTTLTLPAPAKLNLMLSITGRRADGYHLLQTVFQFLDHSDQLHFTLRTDSHIQLTTPLAQVAHDDNLIVRAARKLQQASGCHYGVDIALDKVLPMGGGIGGGSSDAATTLLALNQLWQLDWPLAQLAELGLSLGADVPIFVHGHAAWAEGVGEQLTDVEPPEDWFLVLKPACEISTREIFSHPSLTRNSSPIKVAASQTQYGKNDCEDVVKLLYSDVNAALSWLRQHGNGALTGTGCCVFMRCHSKQHAEDLLQQAPCQGFVARGQNLSPAHQVLKKIHNSSL